MCFKINPMEDIEMVAEEDITVYKVMKESYDNVNKGNWFTGIMDMIFKDYVKSRIKISSIIFRGEAYELGKRYYAMGIDDNAKLYKVTEFKKICCCCINEGFHSYITLEAARSKFKDEFTVKCIIPKGTKYYINSLMGEIVSLEIIFKEIFWVC